MQHRKEHSVQSRLTRAVRPAFLFLSLSLSLIPRPRRTSNLENRLSGRARELSPINSVNAAGIGRRLVYVYPRQTLHSRNYDEEDYDEDEDDANKRAADG